MGQIAPLPRGHDADTMVFLLLCYVVVVVVVLTKTNVLDVKNINCVPYKLNMERALQKMNMKY